MSEKISEDGWRGFLKLCTKVKGEKQWDEFLKLFLTLEEQESIAGRYSIVKELVREKKSQREIAEVLDVSISKITRGSNSLKVISNDLKKLLDSL
jgi:Trp operon repressor